MANSAWRWRRRPFFSEAARPTALTIAQLRYLAGGLRDRLDLSSLNEWTVEANPGSVSPRKAEMLQGIGVNRVSLGVQSWDDDLLKLLGREHNAAQAEASYQILREAGLTNVNIDLMFGLPGQTLSQWEETLRKTIALGPEHISTYCLTYEEDTEFFERQARGEFREDPDSDARFLESAMQLLEERWLRALRNLQLRERGTRFLAQPRILGRRRLRRTRSRSVLDHWVGANEERFELPDLCGRCVSWPVPD